MFKAIAAFFSAIGAALGLVSRRNELKNTPEMQAAARAQQENAQRDAESKAVGDEDEKTIRRNLSE